MRAPALVLALVVAWLVLVERTVPGFLALVLTAIRVVPVALVTRAIEVLS